MLEDVTVDDAVVCDDAEAVDVDGPGLLVGETNAAAQRKHKNENFVRPYYFHNA